MQHQTRVASRHAFNGLENDRGRMPFVRVDKKLDPSYVSFDIALWVPADSRFPSTAVSASDQLSLHLLSCMRSDLDAYTNHSVVAHSSGHGFCAEDTWRSRCDPN